MSTIATVVQEITDLIEENKRLREANDELRGQLEVARRTFGEAFVKGHLQSEKGPGRPNRKKLSERDVRDIRDAYRGGMKQRDLAANYEVNPTTISRIVRRIYH